MRKIVYALLIIAGLLLVQPPLMGAEVATQLVVKEKPSVCLLTKLPLMCSVATQPATQPVVQPVVKEKSSKAPAKKVQQPKATETKNPVKPPVKPTALKLEGC